LVSSTHAAPPVTSGAEVAFAAVSTRSSTYAWPLPAFFQTNTTALTALAGVSTSRLATEYDVVLTGTACCATVLPHWSRMLMPMKTTSDGSVTLT